MGTDPFLIILLIFLLIIAIVSGQTTSTSHRKKRTGGRADSSGGSTRNKSRKNQVCGHDYFRDDLLEGYRLNTGSPAADSGSDDEKFRPSTADLHREKKAVSYGEAGEKELFGILRHGLDPDTYEILYDIMLPSEFGDTTQIDFLVVSEFGVFVIEAKNYAGWIFADHKGKVWTQTLPKGGHKTFQNPIRQNYAHLCALESVTGIPRSVMHPLVAFADRAEFKTPLPTGVCYFSEIVATIQKQSERLVKAGQIPDIVAAILEWDGSITPEQRAAHVANLRARHRSRRGVSRV